jgi:hypothetical protein
MELKDLLETFQLSETDLPGIKDRLKKKAASSARKNDDGPGPPCYLMNDLEAQYSEMHILKKRRKKLQVRVLYYCTILLLYLFNFVDN